MAGILVFNGFRKAFMVFVKCKRILASYKLAWLFWLQRKWMCWAVMTIMETKFRVVPRILSIIEERVFCENSERLSVIFFLKSIILDVWQGFEYSFEVNLTWKENLHVFTVKIKENGRATRMTSFRVFIINFELVQN